jgi:hypothetical protein
MEYLLLPHSSGNDFPPMAYFLMHLTCNKCISRETATSCLTISKLSQFTNLVFDLSMVSRKDNIDLALGILDMVVAIKY